MDYAAAMALFDTLPAAAKSEIRTHVWRLVGRRDVEPTLQGVRSAFAHAVNQWKKEHAA